METLDWQVDEVIHLQRITELERLEKLLDLLIPDELAEGGSRRINAEPSS
jgi:hypothetical protein